MSRVKLWHTPGLAAGRGQARLFSRPPRADAPGQPIGIGRPVPIASTSAVQQGFQNFFKKRRATPTPMGTRAPVRGACVSAMAIGPKSRGDAQKIARRCACFSHRRCSCVGPPPGFQSYVSRTGAAIYIFTGNRMPARDWSPRTNILSLRYHM